MMKPCPGQYNMAWDPAGTTCPPRFLFATVCVYMCVCLCQWTQGGGGVVQKSLTKAREAGMKEKKDLVT